MRTIYKYPLTPKAYQVVEMPKHAKILCVQSQNGTPCLWAEVDTDQSTETRTFYVHGTGHELESGVLVYIGTVQLHGGALVFHVYEG